MTICLSFHTLQASLLFKDKVGTLFLVRLYQDEEKDYLPLKEMYQGFEPKEGTQGLPPRTEEKREEWLKSLLKGGINLLALVEERVVGHAALLEMEPSRNYEYMVFVHQDYQNRGIGTALTQTVKDIAKSMEYHQIWLTVETINLRAIHVYEKVGFCRVGPRDVECEMVINLKRRNEGQ